MRNIIFIVFLGITFPANAQVIEGTYLGVQQSKSLNADVTQYFRFYLSQSNDTINGICEVLDVQQSFSQKDLTSKPLATFRVYNNNFLGAPDLTYLNLSIGEFLDKEQLSNRVHLLSYFTFDCIIKTDSIAPNDIFSLLLPNMLPVGSVHLIKLSEEVPNLSFDIFRVNKRIDSYKRYIANVFRQREKKKEYKIESPLAVNKNLSFSERIPDIQSEEKINSDSFTVSLYDNGVIDNDTVSLYWNKKLLIKDLRLTDKAWSVHLKARRDIVNELTLFAQNLGDISPNTAYISITSLTDKRKILLSGSLEKNAIVLIKVKE